MPSIFNSGFYHFALQPSSFLFESSKVANLILMLSNQAGNSKEGEEFIIVVHVGNILYEEPQVFDPIRRKREKSNVFLASAEVIIQLISMRIELKLLTVLGKMLPLLM